MSYNQYHVRIIFENELVRICKFVILLGVIHASITCQLKLVLNLMKTVHVTLQALSKLIVRLAIHYDTSIHNVAITDMHYIYIYNRHLSQACYNTDALNSYV